MINEIEDDKIVPKEDSRITAMRTNAEANKEKINGLKSLKKKAIATSVLSIAATAGACALAGLELINPTGGFIFSCLSATVAIIGARFASESSERINELQEKVDSTEHYLKHKSNKTIENNSSEKN